MHYAVFTFETSHQAVAAEAVLKRAAVNCESVPRPRQVDAGCVLALRIPLDDMSKAVDALVTGDVDWEAIYQLGSCQEVVAKLG